MRLFMIEPEVAGEIGENTVYENYEAIVNHKQRPIISHLHFIFMGWLGDDILEVTPCFLVSEKLKNTIEKSELTGFEFQMIESTLSDEYLEMYSNRQMPCFFRLMPKGTVNIQDDKYFDWNGMDFCITEKAYLVLSENAMRVLQDYNLENADITELFSE